MKRKGSLTVEAIISFTVFIGVSFLLLTLVKLVLVMIILNNASVEAAKTIATAAYPISIANEAQSGLEKKISKTEPANLLESVEGAGVNSMVSALLGGDLKKAAKGNLQNMLSGYLEGLTVQLLDDVFYSLKGQGVNWLCGKIVSGYVEGCGLALDPERLILRAAKIPETQAEFKALHSGSLPLSEKAGSLEAKPSSSASGSDGDFNAEDVLICLEYPYEIALPLLPAVTVTLRSVSIEHGWLNKTATGPKRTEGIDLTDALFGSGKVVYEATGGHGKRYHAKSDCPTLWTSVQAVSLAAAQGQGLTPCGLCYPETKK